MKKLAISTVQRHVRFIQLANAVSQSHPLFSFNQKRGRLEHYITQTKRKKAPEDLVSYLRLFFFSINYILLNNQQSHLKLWEKKAYVDTKAFLGI